MNSEMLPHKSAAGSNVALGSAMEGEKFGQAILDAISSQIAVLNHEGIILAGNAAWREFAIEKYAFPGQDAYNRRIGANYLAGFRNSCGPLHAGTIEVEQGIRAVLERQLPEFNLDYPCYPPNQKRWFALSVTPLGESCVVITHVDITARKEAEERLVRQRDVLVREAHHQIKNNLQGVAGLLQRQQGKSMEADPRFAAAISQINTIAMLHESLIDRPAEITRLCESIDHICAMVSELAQHPVDFQIEDMQSFRTVHVSSKERVPLALVLNELILNAVKHSPDDSKPPRVSLRTDGTNAWVRIRNAVAVPPDFCLASGRGIGSGLALVRSLLPEQGACLDYKLDQGDSVLATLCLTVPIVEATIT